MPRLVAMFAEHAYLFRHALLRDAAYQLQMPAERAALHRHVLEVLKLLAGPLPRIPDPADWEACAPPGAYSAFAPDLLLHAQMASTADASPGAEAGAEMRCFARLAAESAERQFRVAEAVAAWEFVERFAENPAERVLSLLRRSKCTLRSVHIQTSIGYFTSALAICDLLPEGDALKPRLKCAANHGLAHAHWRAGNSVEAERCLLAAGSLAAVTGEPGRAGRIAGDLAGLYRDLGRHEESAALFELAISEAKAAGDTRRVASWVGNRGILYYNTGRYEEAEQAYVEALDSARTAQDTPSIGLWTGNLANVRKYTVGRQASLELLRQAMAIATTTGDKNTLANMHGSLSNTLAESGQPQAAEEHLLTTLELCRETGARAPEGFWLGMYGVLLRETGRNRQAELAYRQAIEIARDCRDLRGEYLSAFNCSNLLRDTGRASDAVELLEASLPRMVGARQFGQAAMLASGLAQALALLGKHGEAEGEFLRAIAWGESAKSTLIVATCRCRYAAFLDSRFRQEEAARHWAQVEEAAQALGPTDRAKLQSDVAEHKQKPGAGA